MALLRTEPDDGASAVIRVGESNLAEIAVLSPKYTVGLEAKPTPVMTTLVLIVSVSGLMPLRSPSKTWRRSSHAARSFDCGCLAFLWPTIIPLMAQKIVTIYTDDLTGEETREAATHTLVLDGITYEIDLGPDSYDKLLEAVAPFTTAGRKVGGRRRKNAARSAAGGATDTAAVRAWAKENGYEVNERGRVPTSIREAYENAAK